MKIDGVAVFGVGDVWLAGKLSPRGEESSTGRSGRVPRRYRGKDANWWSEKLGLYDRTSGKIHFLASLIELLGNLRSRLGAPHNQYGTREKLNRIAIDVGVNLSDVWP